MLVLAWWCLLLLVPAARSRFSAPGVPQAALMAFLAPDFAVLVVGSFAASVGLAKDRPWGRVAMFVTMGGGVYASLYCLSLSALTGAWLSGLVMVPILLVPPALAMLLHIRDHCPINPRQSATGSVVVNLLKTLAQIFVVWGFFLVVMPVAIEWLESVTGLSRFDSPSQTLHLAGAILFIAMSCLGFGCAMMFAVRGGGTPLPLDGTTCFLVLGPYRYVRNPMAMAGITQGVAVGLWMGSPFVVAYALVGSLIWNTFARPWEEADLSKRFGEPYERYRQDVRCWIPRTTPYRKVGIVVASEDEK